MAADVAAALAKATLSSPAEVARQRFCVTTAINYANGLPHMGHAYEAVSADVVARYHRAFGRQVLFMTGADEHGQKIADAAAQRGVTPIELCNEFVAKFQVRLVRAAPDLGVSGGVTAADTVPWCLQELNARLNISYEVYNRTTSQKHKDLCQLVFQKAQAAGDIYLGSYEGWCARLAPSSARLLPTALGRTADLCRAGTTCVRRRL